MIVEYSIINDIFGQPSICHLGFDISGLDLYGTFSCSTRKIAICGWL